MAYTTGTATDYHDLLADLRTWLTGTLGWSELEYTAPGSITDVATLSVRGPGSGAGREVYVNITTSANTIDGEYGWQLWGATGFTLGLAADEQPGATGGAWFNTWSSTIDYWFYGNDRHFKIVAKVSTNYVSCYCGFFLPFAIPDEYPFPIAIIGNDYQLDTADASHTRNRFIADPGNGAAAYRTRDNVVRQIQNHSSNTTATYPYPGQRAFMWPMSTGRVYSLSTTTTSTSRWAEGGFYNMRLNYNNETPLWQCHIVDMNAHMAGALDRVYVMTGIGKSTEQLVTYGGRNFRLFQNIFRNTPRDFMAIEEI